MMKFLRAFNTIDRLVIGSMLLSMGGVILGAIFADPRFYGIITLVVISLLIVSYLVTRDQRLGWLLLFGIVAGVLELWSDWLHVEKLGNLVYTDHFGFRLLASPSYMPVGWWLTSVQFGYLALRIRERWSALATVALISLLGMSFPSWYEEFAAPAKAWYYTPSRIMLSHTPLWIIFTYGGCMFGIATACLLCYRPKGWGRAIVGGFFAGAGFMFSAVFFSMLLR
ncbi:MAG TPA: hypothetical protein VHY08_22195 [Bacillota bacterium]|nr:hypothetical protein [Bacillota bacterium]